MTERELVFTQLLGCSRLELYSRRTARLGKEKSLAVAKVLARRMTGEPLDYIFGESEFMGHIFKVTPGVLIPRPETEILVETALRLVRDDKSGVNSFKMLDVGTGSGCIAISLKKLLPAAQITAVDISGEALKVARLNARLHRAAVDFKKSDLCAALAVRAMRYDFIISNPPYVPRAEIARLQREIRFEPRLALDAGSDGLDFYRRLIHECPACLRSHGFLLMEIGCGQKEAVKNIIQKSGNFEIIEVVKDYSGIERVVVSKQI